MILGQFTLYSGKHYTVFILTVNENWNDHSVWRKGVHWFRIDFLLYLVNLANSGLVVSYRAISTPSSLGKGSVISKWFLLSGEAHLSWVYGVLLTSYLRTYCVCVISSEPSCKYGNA